MIEAMACGTPVLAFNRGAVREVVDAGVTGYVVDDRDQAVRTLERVLALDRAAVRRRFEERFLVSRMASDYVTVYERLVGNSATRPTGRPTTEARVKANGGSVVH
jgi:glycosyltransferase involved in cell wall biosynthesis